MQFKTIDITTMKGLRQAERLKDKGWIVQTVGFITITLSLGKSNKH